MIVVDRGSSDGTAELVRQRFPQVRLVEQENRGLAAGRNAGMPLASARYYLLLNADAWLEPGAIAELVAFADEHPDAAVVGPRLRYPDGRLQPSVRAFPTLWRLATDYLFLRRLAPRSRVFNDFYGAGFPHDRVRTVDWLVGACLLVRSEAVQSVGDVDERYFLFTEETEWCYRLREAGWNIYFDPHAEVVPVGGAAHQGRFFREQVRGYLRFFTHSTAVAARRSGLAA
jgi:GT2 family glycosyltransferase